MEVSIKLLNELAIAAWRKGQAREFAEVWNMEAIWTWYHRIRVLENDLDFRWEDLASLNEILQEALCNDVEAGAKYEVITFVEKSGMTYLNLKHMVKDMLEFDTNVEDVVDIAQIEYSIDAMKYFGDIRDIDVTNVIPCNICSNGIECLCADIGSD